MSLKEIVLAFIHRWEKGFRPAYEHWIHEDCLWQNTGYPDARGYKQVMELLDQLETIADLQYARSDIINILAEGSVLLTERVDHLWGRGGKTQSAKFMGPLR